MATISWTNSSGGLWSAGTNWSSGSVPGASDDVSIGFLPAFYTIQVNLNPGNVHSLTLSGASATLQLNTVGGSHELDVATDLVMTAGELDLTFGTLRVGGTLALHGGTVNLSSADIEGATIVADGASLHISSAFFQNVTWEAETLQVQGTMEFAGASILPPVIDIAPSTTLSFDAGGSTQRVITMSGTGSSQQALITGAIGANTTVLMTGSSPNMLLKVPAGFSNSGTIRTATGFSMSSTIPTHDLAFHNPGTILLEGGDIHVTGSTVVFDGNSYTNVLKGPAGGTFYISGSLDLSGSTLHATPDRPFLEIAKTVTNGTITGGGLHAAVLNDITWFGTLDGPIEFGGSLVVKSADGTGSGTINTTRINGDGFTTLDDATINIGQIHKASIKVNKGMTLGGGVTINDDVGTGNAFVINNATNVGGIGYLYNYGTFNHISGTASIGNVTNYGTIHADIGGQEFDITSLRNSGSIFVGNSLENFSTGSLYNSGSIIVTNSGTFSVDLVQGSSGLISVGSGGVVKFNGSSSSDLGTIAFTAGPGVIEVDTKSSASITDWFKGDEVRFAATGHTFSLDAASTNDTLLVDRDGSLFSILRIGPGYSLSEFSITQQGSFAVIETTATAPCFVKGTRLQGERFKVAVEDLRVGDTLRTQRTGALHEIIWVGHRTVDCRNHPDPARVWPVRIAAGAFGPHLPVRDLFLSPDHAIYAHGVLIPVKHLINGATIAQVPMDEVTYYHVELPQHDVVLAEQLPVESYLDAGDRVDFANGGPALRLHPEFGRNRIEAPVTWDAYACAPLAVSGPEVERTRQDIAEASALAIRLPQLLNAVRSACARVDPDSACAA